MYHSLLFATLVVLGIASSSLAASAFGPAEVHQSNPNDCYQNGNYYEPGQSWQVEGCGMATCSNSNHTGTPQLLVAYESCGSVSADPPCYTTEDSTLAYPDCCPQPVCPEENENIYEDGNNNDNNNEEDESENEIDDRHDVVSNPKYYEYYDGEYAPKNQYYESYDMDTANIFNRISPRFGNFFMNPTNPSKFLYHWFY